MSGAAQKLETLTLSPDTFGRAAQRPPADSQRLNSLSAASGIALIWSEEKEKRKKQIFFLCYSKHQTLLVKAGLTSASEGRLLTLAVFVATAATFCSSLIRLCFSVRAQLLRNATFFCVPLWNVCVDVDVHSVPRLCKMYRQICKSEAVGVQTCNICTCCRACLLKECHRCAFISPLRLFSK